MLSTTAELRIATKDVILTNIKLTSALGGCTEEVAAARLPLHAFTLPFRLKERCLKNRFAAVI